MSTLPDSDSNFCLFCYKKVKSCVEIGERSDLTSKFISAVTNYAKRSKLKGNLPQNDQLEIILTMDNLLESCKTCQILLKRFCEKYEQLMVLEMELDWKLDKLVDKIEYANKVPARWIHVSKVLEQVFQNDLEKKVDGQNSIRKFRQNVVNTAHQKRQRSQPRIFLRRIEDDGHLSPYLTMPTQNFQKFPLIQNFPENCKTDDKANLHNFRQLYKDKKCPKCGKILKTFKGLRTHLEIHKDSKEWKLECSKCGKKFCYGANLKVHMRSHTGEKPYKCRYCGQRVRHKHSYKKHLNVYHKNEKGFEEELNKRFETSVAQSWKKRRLEMKIREANTRKIYKCSKCGKNLKTGEGLKVHLELHKEQNTWKWKCRQCGKIFADKGNLTVHMRSHTGELPFKCGFCGKKLRYKSSLNRHLNAMHSQEEKLGKELKKKWNNKPRKHVKPIGAKSEDLIESKLFPENDDDNLADDYLSNDEYFDEETSANEDPNIPHPEKVDTNMTFEEPLIQVKVEPLTFDDNEDPLQNSSLHDNSKDSYPENMNKDDIRKSEPISVVPTSKRYSLREKRNTRFTNFEESDTDIEDNGDREYVIESKSADSSSIKTILKTIKPVVSTTPCTTALKCEVCSRQSVTVRQKMCHFKKCHDLNGKNCKPINCTIAGCTAYFLNHRQSHYHRQIEHKLKAGKRGGSKRNSNHIPLPCLTCGKTFSCKSHLELHMQYHKGSSSYRYECKVCAKKCATTNKLKIHMRGHQGEKPFECPFCVKQFRLAVSLNDHLKIYLCTKEDLKAEFKGTTTGIMDRKLWGISQPTKVKVECSGMRSEEVYKCAICGDLYTDISCFNTHVKKHHEPSEWSYECKMCEIKCESSKKLARHVTMHKTDQSVKCQFCGKWFEAAKLLTRHIGMDHVDGDEAEINDKKNKDSKMEEIEDDQEEIEDKQEDNESENVVNEVTNEVVIEDFNIFGRKADCVNGKNLIELEDLD